MLVTGTTAENVDYFDVMSRWLPLVLVFVLGLSFVLLTVAFRSVVIAGTAIVLNLLSVGAAYGLLVLVFQDGVGAGLLGFQQVDVVEAWVPLFLFAVLFGLSMDYQVFLLSRIRERYTQTRQHDRRDRLRHRLDGAHHHRRRADHRRRLRGLRRGRPRDVPADGVRDRGRAADRRDARALGARARRDATARRWNWYLPGWLQWLPHVDVEGHTEQAAGDVAFCPNRGETNLKSHSPSSPGRLARGS